MSRRGPIWGQLKAIMDEKIIEKQLFFLCFFLYLKEIIGILWEGLGGPFGDALGSLWGRLGRLWGRLGKLWGCLGRPWGCLGGTPGEDLPWKTLGKPGKTLPESTFLREPLPQFSYRCMYVLECLRAMHEKG